MMYAPHMSSSTLDLKADNEVLGREIETIANVVAEMGQVSPTQLAERVRARSWGPGRFRAALREAVRQGRVERVSRSVLAPPRRSAGH